MATQDAAKKAYRFLRERSFSQEPFTYEDLAAESGWAIATIKTYISKQLGDVVKRQKGQLLVQPEFKRLSEERFLLLATQKRALFPDYKRSIYGRLIQYEFLLPLTHEGKLRKALDDLFYEDAIRQRLSEISVGRLEKWIPGLDQESSEEYLRRVCATVSKEFSGYSISHVSGRYLADTLTSRAGAAQMLADEQRYIIDETTAAVRFIVPLETSKQDIVEDFEEVDEFDEIGPNEDQVKEERLVRALFFNVFAEAVVRSVEGEDAIWLVEESPSGRKLYVWRKSKSNPEKSES
jgi:hypothetical protein